MSHRHNLSQKLNTNMFTFPPLGTHYLYTWYIFCSPLKRRSNQRYALPLCKLEKWPNRKILCCIYSKFVILNGLFRTKHIASIYQDILQKTFKLMACIMRMSLFLWYGTIGNAQIMRLDSVALNPQPPNDHSLKVEAAILQVGCKNSVLGIFLLEL